MNEVVYRFVDFPHPGAGNRAEIDNDTPKKVTARQAEMAALAKTGDQAAIAAFLSKHTFELCRLGPLVSDMADIGGVLYPLIPGDVIGVPHTAALDSSFRAVSIWLPPEA